MKSYLRTAVYAAALLLGGVSADAVLSVANAQEDVAVSFDSFHHQLAPYGDWVYSDRWGEVWIPTDVPDDFQPYGTAGYWADTDEYGWTWISDYEWGDIPFHYGRWVNDPDDGWLWIPGYVWGPGWVVWRSNDRYTGWMPMPPDDEFLRGDEGGNASLSVSIGGLTLRFANDDDDYGYSRWYGRDYGRDRFASNWFFIDTRYMGERDYRRHLAPRANYTTIINDTRNITKYTVVNNYIVNRSVDPDAVRRAGGQVRAERANDVIKRRQFIMQADRGRDIQRQMRQRNPRGTGFAQSAPKPSETVIRSLSTTVKTPKGHKPSHLFTRDTVNAAPLPARPAGPEGRGERPADGKESIKPNPVASPDAREGIKPNPANREPRPEKAKDLPATPKPLPETMRENLRGNLKPLKPGQSAPGQMTPEEIRKTLETNRAHKPAALPAAKPVEPARPVPERAVPRTPGAVPPTPAPATPHVVRPEKPVHVAPPVKEEKNEKPKKPKHGD